MSLVFDLLDKDKKYRLGTPEDLWKELAIRYDERIVNIFSSHLTRYAGATADTELFKELNDYGPLGKEAARFIQGYIGMDDRLPPIDPEAWTRKRDETGRFTYASGSSATSTTHTWTATYSSGTGTTFGHTHVIGTSRGTTHTVGTLSRDVRAKVSYVSE